MGWSIGRDYGVLPEESGPEANSAGIYHLMENTKKITKIFWPLMNASTLSGPPGAPGMTVFTSPEQDYGHTPGSLPRQVIEPSLCSNCTNQGRTQDPASRAGGPPGPSLLSLLAHTKERTAGDIGSM